MKKYFALACLALPSGLLADWPTDKQVVFEGHADIGVSYESAGDEWKVEVQSSATYSHDEAILLGTPESELAVPSGSSWSFLGDPGDPVWILGSSAPDGVVNLGLNAGGVSLGDLDNDQSQLSLVDYDGPGNFFLYQPQGGDPNIIMDTRPDEGPYGSRTLSTGAHLHFNWAFTERGIHFLTFQSSGVRTADGAPSASDPLEFTFLIEPLPIHWWLLEHFDLDANQSLAGLDADPDGDGISNLLEYAFGLDPLDPSREGLPKMAIENIDGAAYLTITYRRPTEASDILYQVTASPDLDAWSEIDQEGLTLRIDPGEDGIDRVTVRDEAPVNGAGRRFLRIEVTRLDDVPDE